MTEDLKAQLERAKATALAATNETRRLTAQIAVQTATERVLKCEQRLGSHQEKVIKAEDALQALKAAEIPLQAALTAADEALESATVKSKEA